VRAVTSLRQFLPTAMSLAAVMAGRPGHGMRCHIRLAAGDGGRDRRLARSLAPVGEQGGEGEGGGGGHGDEGGELVRQLNSGVGERTAAALVNMSRQAGRRGWAVVAAGEAGLTSRPGDEGDSGPVCAASW
jgi:hypothetical protein